MSSLPPSRTHTQPRAGSDIRVARDQGDGADLSPFSGRYLHIAFIFNRVVKVHCEGFSVFPFEIW